MILKEQYNRLFKGSNRNLLSESTQMTDEEMESIMNLEEPSSEFNDFIEFPESIKDPMNSAPWKSKMVQWINKKLKKHNVSSIEVDDAEMDDDGNVTWTVTKK